MGESAKVHYWSPAVLEHKLERRHRRGRVEEVWNVRRLPKGLGDNHAGDRLYVASGRRWSGSFRLVPEILYTPTDPACPYALPREVLDADRRDRLLQALPRMDLQGARGDHEARTLNAARRSHDVAARR